MKNRKWMYGIVLFLAGLAVGAFVIPLFTS